MNALLVFLLGIGTGFLIDRFVVKYMGFAIIAEQKAIFMEHIRARRLLIEINDLIEDQILEMKR